MIARVFKYSFAQSRTRTMKGKLLSSEDWYYLLKIRSLADILRYLGGTAYAGALSAFSSSRPDINAICLALYDELFKDYGKLLRAVPKRGARIIKSLLLRYEAENLKTIFRGIWQGKSPSEVRSLLYRLKTLSRLPIEELLDTRQIMEGIELLRQTVFYKPIQHALPQFKVQGKLFPLEVAIDTSVFELMRESLCHIGGTGRKRAKMLIAELIDLVNLFWLVRFRHIYGLSAEETINYMLPGGLRVGVPVFGAAARATDLASFVLALPRPYRETLGRAERWIQVKPLLGGWFVGELHRAFLQDPFQVSLQLSYLLLKEAEVKALESLLSTAELGEPTERLKDLICLPVKGGARV